MRDKCYNRHMKRFIASAVLLVLIFPSASQARWLGDYARDLESTLERLNTKIENDDTRERRLLLREERLKARTYSGKRGLQLSESANTVAERLEARRKLRILRRDELNKHEGMNRVFTRTERARNLDVQDDVLNDRRRRADMRQIIEVLQKLATGTGGFVESGLPDSLTEICKTNALSCANLLDLDYTLDGERLQEWPSDPDVAREENGTGYFVGVGTGALTINAPRGSNGDGVSVEWWPLSQ